MDINSTKYVGTLRINYDYRLLSIDYLLIVYIHSTKSIGQNNLFLLFLRTPIFALS